MGAGASAWQRVVSVFASLALALLLVPAVPVQQVQAAPVTKIADVTVDLSSLKPVPGQGATELTTVPDTAGYGVPNEEWVGEDGNLLFEGDVFEQGKTYTYVARLEAWDGYEFDTFLTPQFTGGEWVDGYLETDPAVRWEFDAGLPEVMLSFALDYTVPVLDLGTFTFDFTEGDVTVNGSDTVEDVGKALAMIRIWNDASDDAAVAFSYDMESGLIDVNGDGTDDVKIASSPGTVTYSALDGRSNIAECTLEALPGSLAPAYEAGAKTYTSFAFVFPARSDIAALKAAIAGAEELEQAAYTSTSWAALEAAVADGKAAVDDPVTTPAQGASAAAAIVSAQAALMKRAGKEALGAAIADVETLVEAEYTPATWTTLQATLAAAKTLAAEADASQAAVDAALADLQAARAALERVEAQELVRAKAALGVAAAEALAVASDGYTPSSYRALTEVAEAAKAVAEDPAATVEDVAHVAQILADAKAALAPRADKAALVLVVNAANLLTGTGYTAGSWSGFATARTAAQTVLDDADASQAAVDSAQAVLVDAQAVLVDISDLASAVTGAAALAEADYTAASWKDLQTALTAAKAVLADAAATKAQVEEAAATLAAAVDALDAAGPAAPTVTKPKKVTVKSVQAGKKSVTVKWKKVADVTGYQIAYRVKGAKTWKKATVKKSATSKKLAKLKKGKKYQVKVRAKNVAGWGGWSKVKTSSKTR